MPDAGRPNRLCYMVIGPCNLIPSSRKKGIVGICFQDFHPKMPKGLSQKRKVFFPFEHFTRSSCPDGCSHKYSMVGNN